MWPRIPPGHGRSVRCEAVDLTDPLISRGMGSRGVRSSTPLTQAQREQVLRLADELGLNPQDLQFTHSRATYYSENWDFIAVGPDVFPAAAEARAGGTVFERMTPRAVLAHEGGHQITTRAGTAFEGGSVLDEVQASLVGRELPGLSSMERYQLLRDAAERANASGRSARELLPEIRHGRPSGL